MGLLDQITKGTENVPRRILLYGTHGIGKSTFAAQAPDAIFIQTEEGLAGIECSKFPLATEYSDVIEAITELHTTDHGFKTVVIDSVDWLEHLILSNVCKRKGVTNVADILFSEAYKFAHDEWRQVLAGLTALRDHKQMHVILLSHADIVKFKNPELETYDRYGPKLHKWTSPIIQEWCDEVLFASYKVFTKQVDEGFSKVRAQGVGNGERVMKTEERPSHLAKNRLTLPPEMPLNWHEYAKYIGDIPIKAAPKSPPKTSVAMKKEAVSAIS